MSRSQKNETIVGIATGISKGGVGIVRISGHHLSSLFLPLVRQPLQPRYAHRVDFFNREAEKIDSGIAIYFPGPHSYTGEDVLELHGHGGHVVLQMIVQACLDQGMRLAEAGEFTQRAFLNGKIDLIQAESIADLIDATSQQAVRSANQSLSGVFSKRIYTLIDKIKQMRIYLEAQIDFPEEAIPLANQQKINGELSIINQEVGLILAQSKQGALLQTGVKAVLFGRPNVGKSSLLNCLADEEIAIVSEVAGTTRDINQQAIHISGIPFHVYDTAGIRASTDQVELLGIEKAKRFIAKADVLIEVGSVEDLDADEASLAADFPQDSQRIKVINKIDLSQQLPRISIEQNTPTVYLSAKQQTGIDLLKKVLLESVGWVADEGVFIARQRHIMALKSAQLILQRISLQDMEWAVVAEELRLAQHSLGEITGQYTSEALLGDIFGRFCIGK